MRTDTTEIPVVLTIAGSDSGGGAGIQADLKTFAVLNIFGTSAVTCVTAQNPDKVLDIRAMDPDIVSLQIKAVCSAFPVVAAKTGMLHSASIISAVSKVIAEFDTVSALVVDPVMVSTSGERLLREDAIESLCSQLLPLATVTTPNLPEAEILCGHAISSTDEMQAVAREISGKFGTACVIKGGHLQSEIRDQPPSRRSGAMASRVDGMSEVRGERINCIEDDMTDVLFADGRLTVFSSPRIDTVQTHGTGCTFSAALTAFLARGEKLAEAVEHARNFVAASLKNTVRAGSHRPLGWMHHGLRG